MADDGDSEEERQRGIVIDCGAYSTAAGFAGEGEPSIKFSTIVATDRESSEKYFVGNEVQNQSSDSINIQHPLIEKGRITNWDGMTKIWRNVIEKQLCVSPEDYGLLLTEEPNTPKSDRERMCQIVMEDLACAKFYVSLKPILAMYDTGRTTACVVDVGHDSTFVTPIFEGYALPFAIGTQNYGGRELTTFLQNLLRDGANFNEACENYDVVNDLKEKLAYSSLNFDQDMQADSEQFEKQYELPNGDILTVGKELFQCSEPLFKPSLLNEECDPLGHQVYNNVMKAMDSRRDYYENIVLTGGSSLIDQLELRLKDEVDKLIPRGLSSKVIAKDSRGQGAWSGGSVLGSLSTFEEMWITKQEYEESGPAMVHRKCM